MPFLLCSELSFSCPQTITNVWQWWENTSSSDCDWQSGTVMTNVPSRQSTQRGHGRENLPAEPRIQLSNDWEPQEQNMDIVLWSTKGRASLGLAHVLVQSGKRDNTLEVRL